MSVDSYNDVYAKKYRLCHNDVDDHDDDESTDDNDEDEEEEDVMQLLQKMKRGNRCLENSKCNSLH